MLVLKRNMFVLLPLNLQFGRFMPESLNEIVVHVKGVEVEGGMGCDEPHLRLCMKLRKSEFGCAYVWPPNTLLTVGFLSFFMFLFVLILICL